METLEQRRSDRLSKSEPILSSPSESQPTSSSEIVADPTPTETDIDRQHSPDPTNVAEINKFLEQLTDVIEDQTSESRTDIEIDPDPPDKDLDISEQQEEKKSLKEKSSEIDHSPDLQNSNNIRISTSESQTSNKVSVSNNDISRPKEEVSNLDPDPDPVPDYQSDSETTSAESIIQRLCLNVLLKKNLKKLRLKKLQKKMLEKRPPKSKVKKMNITVADDNIQKPKDKSIPSKRKEPHPPCETESQLRDFIFEYVKTNDFTEPGKFDEFKEKLSLSYRVPVPGHIYIQLEHEGIQAGLILRRLFVQAVNAHTSKRFKVPKAYCPVARDVGTFEQILTTHVRIL